MYRKLRRVCSHNEMNYIPNFRKAFPELNQISTKEMANRFISLGMDFYTETNTPVNPLIRLTLPFAIIVLILMLIALPIVFLFTGSWTYSHTKNDKILNWFRSLKLL